MSKEPDLIESYVMPTLIAVWIIFMSGLVIGLSIALGGVAGPFIVAATLAAGWFIGQKVIRPWMET